MIALRKTTGLSQEKFAKAYGLGKSQWTQIEGGKRIGVDGAMALVKAFRITLDWIYLNDRARMPGDLLADIDAIMAELESGQHSSAVNN